MIRPVQVLLAAALGLTLFSVPLSARAATLPALPAAAEAFDVGSTYVQRFGSSGSPIIFIPGLGCGPWAWAEQIERFSKTHTVYALTLDGFDGRTYTPLADPVASVHSDVWQLIASRHLAKPAIIGHSLGGTLAISLAEEHPELLSGVIALDGLPVFPAMATATAKARESAGEALRSQVDAATRDQLLEFERGYMKNVGTVNADLIEPLAQASSKSDPKAIGAWGYVDITSDTRPLLPKATVSVLELMPYASPSKYTKEQTITFYNLLLAGAPKTKVEAIDGARHFAMFDQPQAVDAAITRFLASVAP